MSEQSEQLDGPAPEPADDAADQAGAPDEASLPEEQPDAQTTEPAFDVESVPGGARSAIEAVVMVVDQPVTEDELASALEIEPAVVVGHLEDLAAEYDQQERGFVLRRIAGAWRVYSRGELAPVVEKFLMDGQQAKLTQASLETLAVIAYRQPISRSRISAVRGVNVDGVIRTLLGRGLIHELGQDVEGGAMMYGTTPYFLQRIGLSSLEELPPLAPYLPDADALDELAAQGQA